MNITSITDMIILYVLHHNGFKNESVFIEAEKGENLVNPLQELVPVTMRFRAHSPIPPEDENRHGF